jgi:hypothetical protein
VLIWPYVAFLGVLVALAAGMFLAGRQAAAEIAWLRHELAVAHAQLYGAWKEGARIAPAPVAQELKEESGTPVPELLRHVVERWEDPSGREAQEREIRAYLDAGWSVEALYRKYENEHA